VNRITRRSLLAGAAGSLLVPAAARAGAGGHGPASVAEEIAASARAELGLAGVAVGVLTRRGEHVAGAGDTGRGTAPDASTVFPIASVTKTFTALALAKAVATGRARLSDPLARHLPRGFELPPGGEAIALEHLATATSGLPRLPAGVEALPGFDPADPYAHLTRADLAALLPGSALEGPPGARHVYSNLGSGLLGMAMETVWGAGYEELVSELVARPLRLRDTVVERDPGRLARSARGHDEAGRPVPDWHWPVLEGAGALYATAADMLRYVRAHLELRPPRLRGALAEVPRPRAPVDETTRIGLAWFRTPVPGLGEIAWHNGRLGGFASYAGYAPDRGVGAVVLANSSVPVDAVGVAAMQLAGAR